MEVMNLNLQEMKKAADVICREIDKIVRNEKFPFPMNYHSVDYILDVNVEDGVSFVFDVGLGEKKAQVSFRMGKLVQSVKDGDSRSPALAVLVTFQRYYEQGAFDGNVISIPNVRTEEKVGRNEPCPCGSDLKYKKCCMGKIASLPSSKLKGMNLETLCPCQKCKVQYPTSLATFTQVNGKCYVIYKKCDCGNGYILSLEPDKLHFRMCGPKEEVYDFYKELPFDEEYHADEHGNFYPHKVFLNQKEVLKYFPI